MGKATTSADKALEEVSFITRRKLLYPKWFLNKRGHTLHNSYFRSKYRRAVDYDKLLATIVRQEFIPTDLVETFKKLQK